MKLKSDSGARASSPIRRRFYAAILWLLWALGLVVQIAGLPFAVPEKGGFALRLWAATGLASLKKAEAA